MSLESEAQEFTEMLGELDPVVRKRVLGHVRVITAMWEEDREGMAIAISVVGFGIQQQLGIEAKE